MATSETSALATDAAPLVRAMAARYATCRSYEDTGVLTAIRHPDDGSASVTSRVVFRTAFDRATGGFLFEYERPGDPIHQRAVIWRGTHGVGRTWATWRPESAATDLSVALQSISGVSDGTARNVPPMLFGWASASYQSIGLRLDGEEEVGGVLCAKVSGRDGTRSIVLWIAKADHSLRRLFESDHFPGVPPPDAAALIPRELSEEQRRAALDALRRPRPFSAEDTVEYAPVFDRTVDAARFEFTPPQTARDKQPSTL